MDELSYRYYNNANELSNKLMKVMMGNTRVTYADDNVDGVVTNTEIRREQNYYSFGMEHKGYNTAMYGVENNLKTYQRQEFTEDLG